MTTLGNLIDLLTTHERRKAVILLGMIMVMALLDVLGIATIMPFIAVLTNADTITSSAFTGRIYHGLGFTDVDRFLFFLGAVMLSALLASIAFKAVTTYAQLRFIYMREYSIARRLVAGYLHQPYAWFLNRNSADLGKAILSEVAQVINNAMMPTMLLLTQGVVALSLLILLIVVDPWSAVAIGSILGFCYGLIYFALRGYLGRIGAERLHANEARFTILSEAFGGMKEVKVGGLEACYVGRFEHPARAFASHQATSLAIAQLPRFALEALAFGGLLTMVLVLLTETGGLQQALPMIALYAFAGYRLLPALQQVYGGFTQLRFAGPALQELHAELRALPSIQEAAVDGPCIAVREAITLRGVRYTYPNAPEPALIDLDITIPARNTVAIVGATGSGKSTTVDLILGLLEPDCGTLAVDGIPITEENCGRWQRSIGYVPQHIYLADDTVAANIAFGVPSAEIDPEAVRQAAQMAALHDFVIEELPLGYATTIGERGVRLSGGQRQRIGVARALYHHPHVLVLDEATSALDSLTEHAVMEAVNTLSQDVTIILIAHRLSTVRQCDQLFLMRRGRLVAQGTYDELSEDNEVFRAMAVG
jgi:ABC-type multidrug transport system fused ATPase/permease subunit